MLRLELLDLALLIVLALMVITDETVLLFHVIFMLLAIGAFYWPLRSFLIRAAIWVTIATGEVLLAVWQGHTQADELIEIPLLSIILLIVFGIARRRAESQRQAEGYSRQLAERASALDALNQSLREERDSRAQLQEEAIRAREQYARMLVHDLKNPLTSALGYLDLLRDLGPHPQQGELVDRARGAAQRTVDLVGDLLDIARMQERRMHLRRELTRLDQLLRACAGELEPWARQYGKTITVVAEPALPAALLDATLMQRVLSNLCSNAIKHTPEGTQIEIGAQASPSELRLWVRDTGQGIAPERQAELFEPFTTAGGVLGGQSNTGLGLAFCKLAVEAHDGRLSLLSAPQRGATFIIHLPASALAA